MYTYIIWSHEKLDCPDRMSRRKRERPKAGRTWRNSRAKEKEGVSKGTDARPCGVHLMIERLRFSNPQIDHSRHWIICAEWMNEWMRSSVAVFISLLWLTFSPSKDVHLSRSEHRIIQSNLTTWGHSLFNFCSKLPINIYGNQFKNSNALHKYRFFLMNALL